MQTGAQYGANVKRDNGSHLALDDTPSVHFPLVGCTLTIADNSSEQGVNVC